MNMETQERFERDQAEVALLAHASIPGRAN